MWALFMWGLGVVLVNAYILYKTAHMYIWCTDKKQIMSQYEFRKSVALAYILNNNDHKKVTETTTNTNISTQSNDRTGSELVSSSIAKSRTKRGNHSQSTPHFKRKAVRFNDKSLHPITGSLRNHLDTSFCHLPMTFSEIETKSLRCQLHRWIDRNIEYKHSVMVCTYCNVSLCVYCYKVFHTMKHVNSLKKYTTDLILKYNHCPTIRQK